VACYEDVFRDGPLEEGEMDKARSTAFKHCTRIQMRALKELAWKGGTSRANFGASRRG
jgi:hypothetical protein